jgi:hypothetical protein
LVNIILDLGKADWEIDAWVVGAYENFATNDTWVRIGCEVDAERNGMLLMIR